MDELSPGQGALPAAAPMAMPRQSLSAAPAHRGRRPSALRLMGLRRAFVILGAIALTAEAAREMARVLDVGGFTLLIGVLLAIFVSLFAWIAFSLLSSLAGFVSALLRGGKRLGIDPDGPLPQLRVRSALLMPTYNEQPARVIAGIEAIAAALAAAGAAEWFDIFLLSDTTDADIWVAEEAAFLALRERSPSRFYYRRRAHNTERKAGNIADWVSRFGNAYPQMLILDADSVMTADAIIRLAAALHAHPDVGLIQTLPVIVNGTTLFARMQQFAGRVYGPVIAHGIAWWHGAEGNYWGHNAMIRTAAFAASAGLPTLRGRKPLGGHILSHDFVEAALLRRAGWAVHMVPALPGSYEESPASLADLAARDRRWCQGNLQHMAVLPARGLNPISRLHLLNGIGSYITAPLWLLFLLFGVLISLQARFVRPDYFPTGRSLFPTWPIIDPQRAKYVFIATMAVLLIPKLLSYLVLLTDRKLRRGCGGAIRALLSLLLESIIAGLLAPVTMLTQSLDVLSILLGRDSGWQAQARDDGSIPLGQVVRLYAWHTVFGLLLATASYLVSPFLLAWMSPVVIGQALAIPLVALTASRGAGHALRRLGLLRIPEESAPPAVLSDAARIAQLLRGARQDALQRLHDDPALLAAHRSMLPPADAEDASLLAGISKIDDAKSLAALSSSLTRPEKAAVLGHANSLERLVALPNS